MGESISVLTRLGIELSDELNNYASLRREYSFEAKRAADFYYFMYTAYEGMDDLAAKGLEDGIGMIKIFIDKAVNQLVGAGFYDIDTNYFVEHYYMKYVSWEDAFNKILQKYESICMTEEEAKRYREARKNNRRKWGVLFSSGDYSKDLGNEFDAGVRNFAEGVGHSIFNAIGNALSESVSDSEKQKLFSAPETRMHLRNAIYDSCYAVHFAVLDVLLESGNATLLSKQSIIESKELATRLLSNLLQGRIPESDCMDVLSKAIEAYPFHPQVVLYLIKIKDISKQELIEYAYYFSIDISEIVFSESFLNIYKDYHEYGVDKRKQLLLEFEELGKTDTNLDIEVKELKKLLLSYEGKQFKSIEEIEKLEKDRGNNIPIVIDTISVYSYEHYIYSEKIPRRKISKARKKLKIPDYDQVIGYIDASDSSIAFCKDGFYFKSNDDIQHLLYNDFNMVSFLDSELTEDDKVVTVIGLKSGSEIRISFPDYYSQRDFTLRHILSKLIEKFTGSEMSAFVEAKKIAENETEDNSETEDEERVKDNSEVKLKDTGDQQEKNPIIKKRAESVQIIFYLIYIAGAILFFMIFGESTLSITYLPITVIFNFLVAKEYGRRKLLWVLLSVIPFSPIVLTYSGHTSERIVEILKIESRYVT